MTRVYVPIDTSALSVDAEGVARAITTEAQARNLPVELVRNGSRGLFWLEPLVEVETREGRVAYGPVKRSEVPELIASGLLEGAPHRLRLGLTDQLPLLARQARLTFARVGVIDPLSLEDSIAHGGFRGLRRALGRAPADLVREVTESGLRGRGGAAFPTGLKWKTVLETPAGNTSSATPTRATRAPSPTEC
jgi:formate dehydrogenase iron-sulfur subunit